MTLPTDPYLTKLRIKRDRAERQHDEAVKAECLARAAYDTACTLYFDRCVELGYCPLCEIPVAECKGHILLADGQPKEKTE